MAGRKNLSLNLARSVTAPWAWALLGAVCGSLLAAGMHMPAKVLAWGLDRLTHGQVQLQEVSGTLWAGSARLVLTGGAGSRDGLALPGTMDWSLKLSGQGVQMTLRSSCCMPQGLVVGFAPSLDLQRWQLRLSDHRSQWPASVLSGLGAPWNTLQPEGMLVLQTEQLLVQAAAGQTQLQGRLQVTAENVTSKLSTLRPMGTYQILLGGSATPTSTPALTLQTQSGSLLLSGQGQWQGSRLRFQGEAMAVPEHAAALSNLLNIIGRRQGARSLLSLG
ncbi:MAG: type II secretion system protein N [Betaproteobacteria bacterium]|jgi:general secretion pathway protein N|nr:type II secretion system protein N [Betaproteobacteria bacterium]